MQIAKGITKIFSWAWFPIKKNTMLMLFMYILGIAVALSELPTWIGAKLYGNLWLELFTDLYAICIIFGLDITHIALPYPRHHFAKMEKSEGEGTDITR